MASTTLEPHLIIVKGSSLRQQPWWPDLRSTMKLAFNKQHLPAFPPIFTRLHPDLTLSAQGLANELGPNGFYAVLFVDDKPVAGGGIEPFRGDDWIDHVVSADEQGNPSTTSNPPAAENRTLTPSEVTEFTAWEICCFRVHPSYRKQGLARQLLHALIDLTRKQGGTRIVANYGVLETGDFWPRMGFDVKLGKASWLKRGFTPYAGREGVREDVEFRMVAMDLVPSARPRPS